MTEQTAAHPEAIAFVNAAVADPDDTTTLLVAADWYAEHGEPLREEHCRVTVKLAQDDEEDRINKRLGTNPLRSRLRELEAALAPAWPCPECRGRGTDKSDPQNWDWHNCPACGGSGDVLRVQYRDPTSVYARTVNRHLPLTFAAGHVAGVTLPRMEDAVEECRECGGSGNGEGYHRGRAFKDCRGCKGSGYVPTPRLRALCATPPWGVPLTWVFAGDREPFEDTRRSKPYRYSWWNADIFRSQEVSNIPRPLFDLIEAPTKDEEGEAKWFPTARAAKLALAAGIAAFGRVA